MLCIKIITFHSLGILRLEGARRPNGNWYQHGVSKRSGTKQLKQLLEAV